MSDGGHHFLQPRLGIHHRCPALVLPNRNPFSSDAGSRSDLIQQVDSLDGDQFTVAQAAS